MVQLTIERTDEEFDRLTEAAAAAGESASELAGRLVRTTLRNLRAVYASNEAVREALAASFRDQAEVYGRLAQ